MGKVDQRYRTNAKSIKDAIDSGMTITSVADLIQANAASVSGWLQRNNMPLLYAHTLEKHLKEQATAAAQNSFTKRANTKISSKPGKNTVSLFVKIPVNSEVDTLLEIIEDMGGTTKILG